MIQRIQSIFLLLTAAMFGLLFKLPFAASNIATAQILSDKIYSIQDHPVLLALAGIGTVLALVAIFLFKNRSLQLRLGYFLIIISILIGVVATVLILNEGAVMAKDVIIDDKMGLFLPLGALIFAILANRFIKKDEKTVRSMDRLR